MDVSITIARVTVIGALCTVSSCAVLSDLFSPQRSGNNKAQITVAADGCALEPDPIKQKASRKLRFEISDIKADEEYLAGWEIVFSQVDAENPTLCRAKGNKKDSMGGQVACTVKRTAYRGTPYCYGIRIFFEPDNPFQKDNQGRSPRSCMLDPTIYVNRPIAASDDDEAVSGERCENALTPSERYEYTADQQDANDRLYGTP